MDKIMNKETIYLAMSNSDMVEGKGHYNPKLTFVSKEDAEAWVEKQPGCMGQLGCGWHIKPIELVLSVEKSDD